MATIPPDRGSMEWLAFAAETGRWDLPEFWRSPEYLGQSPFALHELEVAFGALRELYPPDVAKQILAELRDWVRAYFERRLPTARPKRRRHQSRLEHLLIDFMAPARSDLLELGFNAALVLPTGKLRERLRQDSEFVGAKFELLAHAGLLRGNIPFRPEPFAGKSGPNPDFEIIVAGEPLLMDAKTTAMSYDLEEDLNVVERLTLSPMTLSADEMASAPQCDIEVTEVFAERWYSKDGRSELRPRIGELVQKALELRRELARSPTFPIYGMVEDLIRITVLAAEQPNGCMSRHGGLRANYPRESARVVDRINEHADQLRGHRGLFLVSTGFWDSPDETVRQISEWLEGPEGRLHPNVIGALVLGFAYVEYETVYGIWPVWRKSERPEITHSRVWLDFATGINWQNKRTYEFMKARRDRAE